MLLETISDEEISFLECLYNPICLIESLFGDLDKLANFDEERFSEVRLYQLSMLSYEYLLDYDCKLSKKENFRLRSNAGSIYCFGSRKHGKTLIVEIADLLLSMIHNDGELCGFCSYDAIHIRSVLEKVIQVLENHEFFKIFNAQVNRSPNYRIFLKNAYNLNSINFNLSGENSGGQFYGHHLTRLYGEEASFLTEEVDEKRHDAISEYGCIERFSGMTTFTKYSPIGRIYYDLEKQPFICGYPQYVSPEWGVKEQDKAIQHYSGEGTIGYRVFVKGEVVEDGVSAIDMSLVRRNYHSKKQIKHIEIKRESLPYISDLLIVERPTNADRLYIAEDVGENISEIIIIAQIDKVFHYLYNITLYNLTDKEQFRILQLLGERLKANSISVDSTDGQGRAVYRALEEVFPKENLEAVAFNEKIDVGLLRDDKGDVMFENGQPLYQSEYVDSWSIKRLRDHLYEEGRWVIPLDYKFDNQFNSVIATQSGNRTLYSVVSAEDHLLAAFRVFFIAEWKNELLILSNIKKKTFSKFGA